MNITLVRAWPDRHDLLTLDMADGARIADVLRASGWAVPDESAVGVWGKVQSRDTLLREGDRVEVYRALVADPKTARRRRAAR